MLDPNLIGQALVTNLQNIPTLMQVLNGNSGSIALHLYAYGVEFRLIEALYKMTPPAILLAWDGTQGGNFSGQQIWKHNFRGFARLGNQVSTNPSPMGLSDLWVLIVNGKLGSTTQNIRQVQIYPGVDIMDTPSSMVRQDEEQMDYLEFRMVIPEIGDN